jgi:hypothetical protein
VLQLHGASKESALVDATADIRGVPVLDRTGKEGCAVGNTPPVGTDKGGRWVQIKRRGQQMGARNC